jgi:predicted CxxxxCH...CXXCH cytochrome family protein
VGAVGHADSALPAELSFRAPAASTRWNGSTCSSSYCHGATLAGGAATSPRWTVVDGSQARCTSCHGNPPPSPHPADDRCASCHGDVIATNGSFIAPALHLDGTVQVDAVHPPDWAAANAHGTAFDDGGAASCNAASCHGASLTGGSSGVLCNDCHSGWATDCTFCHGGRDNATGAPPAGVRGETARTTLAVGAHTAHVAATATHAAWQCGTCHVTPSSALSPNHVDGDGRAEIVFSSLNAAATYSASTGGCASLYCHGNGRTAAGVADWDTDPTLSCSSCHATNGSGMSGDHAEHVREGTRCYDCHATVVSTGNAITGKALHVDGDVAVSMPRGGSYDPATRRCANLGCHGSETW